jgi:heat shock protein HslJ
VVAFLKSNNPVVNRTIETGISEVQDITSTSTSGVVTSLSARTVENKAAYSRIQSDWIWVKTTYSNAGWASAGPTKGKDFTLTLNDDKTLSVAGDCNAIKGEYTLDENTVSGLETEDEMSMGKIKVSAVATTKKYCDWSKENVFLKDFSKISAYTMRTLQLELFLPDGQGTMIFNRKEELEG